jgi:hypothetical protein
MLNFDATPPNDLGRSGFRLVRTPPAHPLIAVVLSETLTGCKTHFCGNRTIPCESPDCEACKNGIGWRWHAYTLVKVDATQEVVLFETTANASAAFTQYIATYGTLRGCHFKASRVNGRGNGRVIISAHPADLSKITLPAAQPIEPLLCHIWNMAPNQVERTAHMTRPPAKNLAIDRTKPETVIPIQDAVSVAAGIALAKQRQGNGRH